MIVGLDNGKIMGRALCLAIWATVHSNKEQHVTHVPSAKKGPEVQETHLPNVLFLEQAGDAGEPEQNGWFHLR